MLQSGKPQVARLRSPRRPRIEDSRDHENRRFSNDCARLTIRGSHGSLHSPFEQSSASIQSADRSLPALPAVACLRRPGWIERPAPSNPTRVGCVLSRCAVANCSENRGRTGRGRLSTAGAVGSGISDSRCSTTHGDVSDGDLERRAERVFRWSSGRGLSALSSPR